MANRTPNAIVVLGSLNMDLVVKAERAPEAGETLAGQAFQMIPGGKGANQAAAIARLGGQVAMVGRVGVDDFGRRSLANLAAFGVDTSHVQADPDATSGMALIVVEASGENRILLVPGANARVSRADVDAARPLIERASILVLQMEIPQDTVVYALGVAQEYGVPTLLNLAPAYPLPDDVLRMVSYLILNESEASVVSGLQVTEQATARSAAAVLLERGVGTVLLTLGSQGVLLAGTAGMLCVPGYRVEAVDTTAAGDAFIGGFAVSLQDTGDLQRSAQWANAVGALTVTRFGAQTALPTRSEVDAFIADHPS